MSVYLDDRWIGPHGIGRFASEVSHRCGFTPLGMTGQPLSLLDPWMLNQALAKRKPGHFFSPGFNAPLGRPCSFSLTIHDLIHLEVADETSVVKRLYYRWIVLPALHRADVVFTVSEYSRQKIAEWSGLESDRIVVAGNGVSELFSPEGEHWHWHKPYLLYVGNQKPHKNVEGLVKAYADSQLSEEVDLLLTGQFSESVARVVTESGITSKVKSLGLIPEIDLPKLYRGAFALAIPSRYEGFGLPLVEAMASGVPVLSSDRTSLPEIGGGAVAYFNPDQHETMVEGLNALMDESHRSRLRASGLVRAQGFRWESVAQRVSDAIHARIGANKA